MENNDSVTSYNYHPIQLNAIYVKELSIVANVPPDEVTGADADRVAMLSGHSEYKEKEREIGVSTKIECGLEEGDEQPYSMKIEIVGSFSVDEDKFPVEHLEHWASRNAPIILLPYLREHAFALTARAGFKPLVLPLMEVPTFRRPAEEEIKE